MNEKNWLQEEYERLFKVNFDSIGYLSFKKVKYILREIFSIIEKKDLIIASQKYIIDYMKENNK